MCLLSIKMVYTHLIVEFVRSEGDMSKGDTREVDGSERDRSKGDTREVDGREGDRSKGYRWEISR